MAVATHPDPETLAAPPGRLPPAELSAVAEHPVSDPLTNPNLLVGTPDYLSPEQARNSHAVDHRSDIDSLGCTLFFLLTGRPPFAHAATLIDKLLAHTEETPPAIRAERPDVPEGLAAVLAPSRPRATRSPTHRRSRPARPRARSRRVRPNAAQGRERQVTPANTAALASRNPHPPVAFPR